MSDSIPIPESERLGDMGVRIELEAGVANHVLTGETARRHAESQARLSQEAAELIENTLRAAFEDWLDGWSADVLPRERKGVAYDSHHTELAWLAFKAGANLPPSPFWS